MREIIVTTEDGKKRISQRKLPLWLLVHYLDHEGKIREFYLLLLAGQEDKNALTIRPVVKSKWESAFEIKGEYGEVLKNE